MSFALRLYPLAGGRMPAAGDVDFSDDPYLHCRFYLRFLFVTAFGLQSLRLGAATIINCYKDMYFPWENKSCRPNCWICRLWFVTFYGFWSAAGCARTDLTECFESSPAGARTAQRKVPLRGGGL